MKLINKQQIQPWLAELEKQRQVWVPVMNADNDLLYSRLGEGEICYELKPMLSCRSILFPQEDSMFKVHPDGKIEPTVDNTRRVLFGIRNCDASAIAITDDFFSRNFKDSYYLPRRQNAILITLGCNYPMDTCWCKYLGTGPFIDQHFDIQLYQISDHQFLAQTGSSAGQQLIAEHGGFFEEMPATQAEEHIARLKQEADSRFAQAIDFSKALEIAAAGKVAPQVFETYADECLACGACAFVCPTCTCFDVKDITDNQGVVNRCRQWENCFFKGFTIEASGHNPRRMLPDRIARRFDHKLQFQPKMEGHVGCTGCGRCTMYCITKIGMHRFAELTVNAAQSAQ